jgi:alpha-N-arabinofuranosidase
MRMRKRLWLAMAVVLAAGLGQAGPGTQAGGGAATEPGAVGLTVHTDAPAKHIDVRIYSQFLEHIFNSVHGGLWGDQILNGTLEVALPRAGRNGEGDAAAAGGFKQPMYWEAFGPGRFENDRVNPKNSEVSLRVTQGFQGTPLRPQVNTIMPEPTGIRQRRVAVKQGEEYTLTFYARTMRVGTTRVQMYVEVPDEKGGPPLQSAFFTKDIEDLTPDWKKYSFTFSSNRARGDAVLAIGLIGNGDLSVDQVSLFSKTALANGGFRPDLLQMVDSLKPATIRWPGGSFANTYMWEYGVGPAEERRTSPVEAWNDRDPNQFGTDEFMRLCEKVHAEPLLVLNTRRGIEPNMAWLEYCLGDVTTKEGRRRAENGHPEPYKLDVIEIDNEPWLLMDQARYLEIVHAFSAAIRAKYPQLHLSVAGGYAFDTGPGEGIPQNAGWDAAMLKEAAKEFDILSPHYYNGLLDKLDYVNNPKEYEKHLVEVGEMIKASGNPNIKLYVSEWNAQSTDWRTGLYAGGILNAVERQADLVAISCPALFLRRDTAKSWDNALINFNQERVFPAPNAMVMSIWRDHFEPNLLKTEGGEETVLSAVATEADDKRTVVLKLVNPGKTALGVTATLEGAFVPGRAAVQMVAPGSESARNTLKDPGAIRVEETAAAVEGQRVRVTLPPLSVAAVRVTAK